MHWEVHLLVRCTSHGICCLARNAWIFRSFSRPEKAACCIWIQWEVWEWIKIVMLFALKPKQCAKRYKNTAISWIGCQEVITFPLWGSLYIRYTCLIKKCLKVRAVSCSKVCVFIYIFDFCWHTLPFLWQVNKKTLHHLK